MSSKRNHAIRSRKTYKSRMNAARIYCNGAPPKGAAGGFISSRTGPKPKRSLGIIRALGRIVRRNREKKTGEE